MADSIINCDVMRKKIVEAMHKALSSEFREKAKEVESLYDKGDTSENIVNEIAKYLKGEKGKDKVFFDVDF